MDQNLLPIKLRMNHCQHCNLTWEIDWNQAQYFLDHHDDQPNSLQGVTFENAKFTDKVRALLKGIYKPSMLIYWYPRALIPFSAMASAMPIISLASQ